MPQGQFQRVKPNQKPSPAQSREFTRSPQSLLTQETMRPEIRLMKLEKTFREQGTFSQAVVRIVNEAARDREGNEDAGGSRTPQK